MLKALFVDNNPIAKIANSIFGSSPFLSSITNYVKQLIFNKDDNNLEKLLFLIGVVALTYKTGKVVHQTYKSWNWIVPYLIRQSKLNGPELKKKYGNCWVVITGFTQGIGKGFAEIFAEFGFNLLLISRNEQKCKTVADQLRVKYQQIDIKYISCNLADKDQINRLQTIFDGWNDLDIGIVVNNAGSVAGGPYFTIAPQMLVDDINVDLLAVFVINKILVPKMRQRHQRSAIMNIASCTGVYLSPRLGVYSSTKRTVDLYSKILQSENNDKIDIISVRPFGVCTKMMKFKKGPLMITPRQCAFAAIADMLAGCKVTFTHFKHNLNSVPFTHLSEDESFALYEYYWGLARAAAAD